MCVCACVSFQPNSVFEAGGDAAPEGGFACSVVTVSYNTGLRIRSSASFSATTTTTSKAESGESSPLEAGAEEAAVLAVSSSSSDSPFSSYLSSLSFGTRCVYHRDRPQDRAHVDDIFLPIESGAESRCVTKELVVSFILLSHISEQIVAHVLL
jgi:hypothetical protein